MVRMGRYGNLVYSVVLTCSTGMVAVPVHAQQIPVWTAKTPNPSVRPFGGLPVVPGVTLARLYNATVDSGLYNHVPMLDFYGSFLATWINAPVTEGDASRVAYSQSLDGETWTPMDVIFPNLTEPSGPPIIMYPSPALHINGRVYAAASRSQTELYPVEWFQDFILRSVDTVHLKTFGPLFWSGDLVPRGFEAVSAQLGILTLNETDAVTQGDIRGSGLGNRSAPLPCEAVDGVVTETCEGCVSGCVPEAVFEEQLLNERTHYTLPPSAEAMDVELMRYKWCPNDTSTGHHLFASVRVSEAAGWSTPVVTNIPDSCSNINAGALPDGRRFLLSNSGPYGLRDPLTIALSTDGLTFNESLAIVSCTQLSGGCTDRGGNGGGPGVSYPQSVLIESPVWAQGLWIIFSNNKEDIHVARVPIPLPSNLDVY
jgi:hypothetical protein